MIAGIAWEEQVCYKLISNKTEIIGGSYLVDKIIWDSPVDTGMGETIVEDFISVSESEEISRSSIVGTEKAIRPFNPNEYSLNFEFDNAHLTAITNYLSDSNEELSKMVFDLDSEIYYSGHRFTIWNYLSYVGYALQIVMLLFVLIWIINRTRLRRLLIGVVIVVKNTEFVEGLSLDFLPTHTVAWTSMANLIIIGILILIVVFYWKNIFRKKTVVSVYTGNCFTSGQHSTFSIRINMFNKIAFIRKANFEIIQIRMSLRDIEEVFDVKVINPLNFWFISPTNELRLVDEISLCGINRQGRRVFRKKIAINLPVKNISWTGNSPKTIKEINSNNFAIISVNRKE